METYRSVVKDAQLKRLVATYREPGFLMRMEMAVGQVERRRD